MKKYSHLFLFCAYLFSLLTVAGCGDDCSGCPEDVELSDLMELRVPYQVGQVVRFANATGDTIALNCMERAYSQQESRPMERPYSECCPSYFAENVACLLAGDAGNFIRVFTDYSVYYSITVAGSLKGLNYNIGSFQNKIDSVQINGQTFINVSISDKNNDNEVSVFLGNDGKGIVGYILNGEEWALVE